jgi:formimidoylglutamate deiminase
VLGAAVHARRWSTRTATPSSVPSSAWPNGATALHDDFWSWRDRMYGVALRITPDQLRAVATHLYAELLAGGYTQVCEFHYLQHASDGAPYADPAEMAWALADAAADAGIGLTLLPTLYERSGFGASSCATTSGAFAPPPPTCWPCSGRCAAPRGRCWTAAPRSIRCARPVPSRCWTWPTGPTARCTSTWPSSWPRCATAWPPPAAGRSNGCCATPAWTRAGSWCMPPTACRRVDGVATRGAGVVLCPGTEANLGDGLPDLPGGWLAAGVPLSLGSDSQVTRSWPEELRWLDYAQRLVRQQRNVAAAPGHQPPPRHACSNACARAVLPPPAAHAGACGAARGPTCCC